MSRSNRYSWHLLETSPQGDKEKFWWWVQWTRGWLKHWAKWSSHLSCLPSHGYLMFLSHEIQIAARRRGLPVPLPVTNMDFMKSSCIQNTNIRLQCWGPLQTSVPATGHMTKMTDLGLPFPKRPISRHSLLWRLISWRIFNINPYKIHFDIKESFKQYHWSPIIQIILME